MKGWFFLKKVLIVLISIIMIVAVKKNVEAENIIIPDEAIRLRIIPNSNNPADLYLKGLVQEKMKENISNLLTNPTQISSAREIIENNLSNFNNDIKEIFNNYNYDYKYKVKYGYNYFPQKEYKGITYNEGYYESLVVELGDAKGDNWWCVLFPPLCLLEAEENTEVEYKFFVKELINKIFWINIEFK